MANEIKIFEKEQCEERQQELKIIKFKPIKIKAC